MELNIFMNDFKKIQYIYENLNSNYFYHATYSPLLKSIQRMGLGGSPNSAKNWDDSKMLYI